MKELKNQKENVLYIKILSVHLLMLTFLEYIPPKGIFAFLFEELVANAYTYSNETNQEIIQTAIQKGITQGNRMYQYMNVIFIENKEDIDRSKKYNDLTFIGNFKNPKPKNKK